MKKNTITSTIGVLGLASLVGISSLCAQDAPATPPAAPELPSLTDAEVKEISSYLLGLQSSSNFAGAGLTAGDVDMAQVSKGFIAGLNGEQPTATYPEPKIEAAMKSLGETVQARAAKKGEENLAAGKAFLAENGKREGVTTTASGLQYEVITAGSDKKFTGDAATDTGTKFMVNYRGTLIDGTEFDKSPEGQPFPMTLGVIPGFKEALTTMPVGAKWKLFIPSELAYGPQAMGPQIQANSTLIFELELLEIKAAPPAPVKASAVTPPVPVPAAPKK